MRWPRAAAIGLLGSAACADGARSVVHEDGGTAFDPSDSGGGEHVPGDEASVRPEDSGSAGDAGTTERDAALDSDLESDSGVDSSTPALHPTCGGDPASSVVAEPLGEHSCTIFPFQSDLWMLSSWRGTGLFDYRFGGAGAVAEMRDVQNGCSPLLAPTFRGEMTDRVIQWVAWDLALLNPLPGMGKEWMWRFNVTQAGNHRGTFNPTVSVRVDHGKCLVDVWSVPQIQWFPEQDPWFLTRFAALTRYQLVANGDVPRAMSVLAPPGASDPRARRRATRPPARRARSVLERSEERGARR